MHQLMGLQFDHHDEEDKIEDISSSTSELTNMPNFERNNNEYWHRRCIDARTWAIWMNVSNVLFQSRSIMNPMSDRHYYYNIGYFVVTIICACLITASYYKKKHMVELIRWTNLILIVRNVLRPFDFEQTRDFYEEPEGWIILVCC
jgi:hypothetical protein